MAKIDFNEVRKSYGTNQVVHGITLTVADGEFVVLVGPSGCGKSTLLRMVAGLEEISAGTISIGGRVDGDGAAGLFLEPRQNAQQGRLAAARRADDANELAARDVEADVLDRDDAIVFRSELLAQPADRDRRAAPFHHVAPSFFATGPAG